MSNITKSWFYNLQKPDSSKIVISDNLVVSLFDYLNQEIEIEIWENSRVEFYSILKNREDIKVNFLQNKQNSELKVRCLLLSKDNEKVNAKIYSELSANYVKSDVKIISIVWNDGFVDLDWVIQINEWVEKVEWNLVEENLFIGNTWKVKWVPTLLVRSDDVKASHSCKMERISDENLFYLRSRWINKDDSLKMIIDSKIVDLFWEYYNQVENIIVDYLLIK